MVELIDSFGKTFLLCICVSAVFALAFFEIRNEGKTGILDVVGEQSKNYAQQPVNGSNRDEVYQEFLDTPGYKAQLITELHAGETYQVKDIFEDEDTVQKILITGVYEYPAGEIRNEYVLQGGEQVCFQKSGLYVIKVWSLNNQNVETKQSFYLSVKQEEI